MLNLENFFMRDPKVFREKGFIFSNLMQDLKIKDGVLSTHDLVIKSPIINIGATGDIDLNNKKSWTLDIAAPLVTIG